MEQLNSLIRDAANQFECHNFQTSLSLYVRCIDRCLEQKLPKYILYNLKSSQAALRTIFGQYQTALSILNEVLSDDRQHWLSLIRRSQIYKKQNKYKKAMKDLDVLTMYAPDNMQVAALKLQIKGFMANINASTSSQSQSENQELSPEEQSLKFSNLRKIDRTSVSIMLPSKGRQSRVTILGDKSFFYEVPDNDTEPPTTEMNNQARIFTPSFNCERFIQIDKQLQEVNLGEDEQVPVVRVRAKQDRCKSILKNRNSMIYRSENGLTGDKDSQKRLLIKVKNIDGRMIAHEMISNRTISSKQVEFKKSLFSNQQESGNQHTAEEVQIKKKPLQRKSCLKRSSFAENSEEVQHKTRQVRKSKFESLGRSSIDGKLIRSEHKKKQPQSSKYKQNTKENMEQNSDNESDQGSHFNIFGSKKIILNKQLRENLGLESDSVVEQSQQNKSKKKDKKQRESILKTSSIVVRKVSIKKKDGPFFKSHLEQENKIVKGERKNKKSVMFISF